MEFKPKGLLFWHKILILLVVSIVALTMVIGVATWHSLRQAGRIMGNESKEILSVQTERFILELVKEQGNTLDLQMAQAKNSALFGANFFRESISQGGLHDSVFEKISTVIIGNTAHITMVYLMLKGEEQTFKIYPDAMYLERMPPGFDLQKEAYFPREELFSLRGNEVLWSEAHINPFSDHFDFAIEAIAPIVVKDTIVGYFGVTVSVTHLIGQFNKRQPVRGGYSFIINTQKKLLGAPPHARVELSTETSYAPRGVIDLRRTGNEKLDWALQKMVLGESGVTSIVINGEPKYLVSHPLISVNWRLGLVVSVRMATAASGQLVRVVEKGTKQALSGMLFWAISFLLFVLAVGFMLSHRLTASIRSMSEATLAITQGNYGVRILESSRDELGSLAKAFNMMADKINKVIYDLNQLNEELFQKNKSLEEEVTERQAAAARLIESEEKYRSLVEAIPHGILEANSDGAIIYVNPAYYQIFGCEKWEILGKSFFELAEPDLKGHMLLSQHSNSAPLASNPRKYFGESLTKDGRTIDIQMDWDYKRDSNGNILGFTAIITDISERKRAEEALRSSEARMRLIIESSPIGIRITQGGKYEYVNPIFVEMFEYGLPEEIIGLPVDALYAPEPHEDTNWKRAERLDGTERPSYYEVTGVKKNGEHFDVALWLTVIEYQNEPGILGFVIDISEEKKLKAQLLHSQKMEAVGTLAGGIAHDFNNILMGIVGYVSLMELNANPRHPNYERIKAIKQQVNSAAELTRQLLGFARGGKYEVKPTDVNQLVGQTVDMFGRTRREVNIHAKYQEDIWTIEVDQGQIEQVLLNLFINAWHAMPGGGDLIIETANLVLDSKFAQIHQVGAGRYVKVTVADTGVGMDPVTKEKVFEPFFTTKEMGRGTGLGLASAYGIIRNHGGIIEVDSQKNVGTTFKIYFPASGKAPIEEKAGVSKLMMGRETVLLVDDDPFIIKVGEQMLAKLGYRVYLAGSGQEAINIFKEKEIDLIILDMIMPDMSGSQTFDSIRAIDPGAKVLLASGYSLDGQATEIIERGCNGFIQKPFSIMKLSHALREILDK